jgi:hypothetical protein
MWILPSLKVRAVKQNLSTSVPSLSIIYTDAKKDSLLAHLEESWKKTLSCLHSASQINSISLLLDEESLLDSVRALNYKLHHQPPAAFSKLATILLHSIFPVSITSNTYPFLTSLTIDFQPNSDVFSEISNLDVIATRLEHLRVTVVNNEQELNEAALFWKALTDQLLKPATNLRTLSLISRSWAGVLPCIEFNELTYSFLHSLSLRYIQFREQDKESGVEGMISRSRNTLRRLELDGCSIHRVGLLDSDHEESVLEGFERRWSDVWASFSDELVNLHELVVRGMTDVSDRYQISEDDDISPIEYETTDEDEERDAAALEALCQVVRSRSGGRAVVIEDSQ